MLCTGQERGKFCDWSLSEFTHLCSSSSFAGVGIQVQNYCEKRLLLNFFWQTCNLGVSKISSESLFSWESCPDFQQIWNIFQGSVETYTMTQLQQSLWLSFFDVVWLCWVCGFVGFRFWLLGWIFFVWLLFFLCHFVWKDFCIILAYFFVPFSC